MYALRECGPASPVAGFAIRPVESADELSAETRLAIVRHGGESSLTTDLRELKDHAMMWTASFDGNLASVLFTRRGRYFRNWFVPLEPDDVVLFRMRTYPEFRGRGLAPALMRHAVNECLARGGTAYIDCRVYNRPSIRSIEKVGFKQIATMKPIRREDALG